MSKELTGFMPDFTSAVWLTLQVEIFSLVTTSSPLSLPLPVDGLFCVSSKPLDAQFTVKHPVTYTVRMVKEMADDNKDRFVGWAG